MSEAILTSHLTISYLPTPSASASAAPAGKGAASGPAPAETGPAGFLAALIDQLLAGAGAAAPSADGPTAASTDAAATAPVPFGTPVDPAAVATMSSSPRGQSLLAQLTRELRALKDELDQGEAPDADLLKRLGETVDAIAALIEVPAAPAGAAPAGPVAADTRLDPLAAIGNGTVAVNAAAARAAPAQAAPAAAAPATQLAQYVASLGGNAAPQPNAGDGGDPAASPPAASAGAAAQPPLPGIAKLAETLGTLSQALAPATPELAQKLAALGQRLEGAEVSPQVLAQLTLPADADATQLDRVVQRLLNRLAGTPLQSPSPEAASASQTQTLSARIAAPVPPAPPTVATATPTASSPAPDAREASTVSTTSGAASAGSGGTSAKPEAKLVAEAATATRPDAAAADSAQQQTASAAAAATASGAPAPTAATRLVPAAYQPPFVPINMGQMAFEMIRQMHQGISRFTIRLDPPELGRVDVKMHVDASGTINARLTVDKAETLDMFQRDRGTLERALSQAGLDGARTNLEFSLRQNPFAGMAGNFQRPSGGNTPAPRFSPAPAGGEDAMAAVPAVTLYRGAASAGGVNLFV